VVGVPDLPNPPSIAAARTAYVAPDFSSQTASLENPGVPAGYQDVAALAPGLFGAPEW